MKDLLLAIRRERYDVVVNSQGQMIGLLSCLFSGARLRIGFDSFPGGSATTASCVFARTPNSRATAPWLTIASRCSPLKLASEDRNYYLWLSEEEKQQGKDALLAAGVDLSRPLIAMGVNSLGHYKRWPIDCFAKVAQWLIEQHDAQI